MADNNKTTIVAIRPDSENKTDIKFLKPGADAEIIDRARRALSEFHRIRPQLAAFARVMTGNPNVGILPTGGAPATEDRKSTRLNSSHRC